MNKEVTIEARKLILAYLKKRAEEKGITQLVISEKMGKTQSNISRMFAGKYPPTLDNLIDLANICECYVFVIDKNSDDDLCKIMKDRWNKAERHGIN